MKIEILDVWYENKEEEKIKIFLEGEVVGMGSELKDGLEYEIVMSMEEMWNVEEEMRISVDVMDRKVGWRFCGIGGLGDMWDWCGYCESSKRIRDGRYVVVGGREWFVCDECYKRIEKSGEGY